MNKNFVITGLIATILFAVSCKNDHENDPKNQAVLQLKFHHFADGAPVNFDQMIYENAAGNEYEVTEVQWFISDVILTGDDIVTNITQDDNIHYIDTGLPDTWQWNISKALSKGNYNHLKITFGIKGEVNTVGRFPDLPESNMIWPYHMGGDNGGYHYMKLNGFWIDTLDIRQPFNFHLGVGKTLDENDNAIYYQNWFESTFTIDVSVLASTDTVTIPIIMNIENWFQNPNTWNFNEIGSRIMNNQAAMAQGIENGQTDVFSLGPIETGGL